MITPLPKATPIPPLQIEKHIGLFLNRMKGKRDQTYINEILGTVFEVKINILLMDAIQQMPPYAKFLKELCTTKRVTIVLKRVFLSSNFSFITSSHIFIKYKDLCCHTISIVTGD